MLSEKTLEFQFEYKDEKTPLIELTYDPVNDSNRVLVKKLLRDTEEYLEGAVLRLEREEKVILEPDERGDQGESQKKDQKKYQAKDQMKEEKTWVVVETWITGKQPHLIKGLTAGDYRLVEKKHRRIYEIRRTGVFYHYRWNDRNTGDYTAQLWHHYIRRKKRSQFRKTSFRRKAGTGMQRYHGSDQPMDIRPGKWSGI